MNLESMERLAAKSIERRARTRLRLHWPVSILKPATGDRSGKIHKTLTENLSTGGFCCSIDERLAVGERVGCLIRLPSPSGAGEARAIHCDAAIIWVREQGDGTFGIGCRVADYAVIE